ncbi:uncharacterized protein LOC141972481 isoform X6 [Athene noctua]|uniref:uncharacterized protein LOC141972481 isoform X6 n=1 Tax=Athene noctua TaxID=126797 RepID=UPI003EBC59E3
MPVPMSISVLVSLMLLLSPLCCPLRSVPMSVLPPSLSPGSFTLFPVPCVLFSCLCAVPISVPGVPHAVPRPLRAVPMSLCCPHLCPRGPSRCSPSPPCCSRVSVLSPSLSPGSLTLFPVPSVLSPCLHTISPSIPISLTALQGTSVTGPGLGSHWGTLMAAPLCALTAPASLTPSLRSSGAPGGCSLPQGGAVAMPGHPGLPAVVTLAGPGTRATTGLAQGSSSPREGRAVPSLSPGTAAGTAAAAEDPSVQRVAMDHRAPGHWRSPCSAAVLAAALLLSCPSPARGQAPPFVIRQDPVAARAGGNVTFVLEPAPGRVLSCSWYRAPSTDLDSEIFTYYTEPDLGQQNGRAYTGRETGAANCSMCIRQLRLNDSGAYTVAVRQPASASASASLVVHGPSDTVCPLHSPPDAAGSDAGQCDGDGERHCHPELPQPPWHRDGGLAARRGTSGSWRPPVPVPGQPHADGAAGAAGRCRCLRVPGQQRHQHQPQRRRHRHRRLVADTAGGDTGQRDSDRERHRHPELPQSSRHQDGGLAA